MADLNGDFSTDIADYAILSANYGRLLRRLEMAQILTTHAILTRRNRWRPRRESNARRPP